MHDTPEYLRDLHLSLAVQFEMQAESTLYEGGDQAEVEFLFSKRDEAFAGALHFEAECLQRAK